MILQARVISPDDLYEKQCNDPDVFLLDVRTTMEHRQLHAHGATLHPLQSLDIAQVKETAGERTIYLICQSGSRASKAYEQLAAAGIKNAVVVEGGTEAWVAAGLPVIRSQGGISLMRQVQIAAGSLVVAGVALGVLVHPGFLGLSAFVGTGLVFAGISNTCGMALLLARMPWNRQKNCGASCSVG